MSLDFTLAKYREIVDAIAGSEYKVLTIKDYILSSRLPEKYIIIRHDVDLDPHYQVRFAELEHQSGIHTSYYFRYVEKIFKKDVIDKVCSLGHEIGYHYEVFTKARGDEKAAMEMFRDEIAVFKKHWDTVTVCPHGGSFVDHTDGYDLKGIIRLIPKMLSKKSVFSKWVNFDIWEKYRFDEFGIIGDSYKSFDFSNILYLSDTGRSWDIRFKRLDKVNSNVNPHFPVRKSDEIIEIIRSGKVNKIYLLVHFEQWKDNFTDWLSWYAAQIIRRTGKKILFGMKKV